jgi:Protein of unknown function (DUF3606)
MADDRTQSGGSDRKRINTNQDYELRDWANKFGVSPEAVKKAVAAVGDDADKVQAHLKRGGAER